MLCRLTHTQARAIELRMPELYVTAMREHRTVYGKIQHDYDLPAIAWRQILDSMVSQCYGPAGGKLKGPGRPSDSALLAIRRVAEAVKRIESHPALRGASVEGWVTDVIPAWARVIVSGEPGVSGYMRATSLGDMTAYPQSDRRFMLLIPQHVENLGMKVTRWEPDAPRFLFADAPHQWTFVEASHLSFVKASV